MSTHQITHFSRKILAGSLSFFLLSSNFSFLGVVLEPIIGTTYATYVGYNPSTQYVSGDTFNYNGVDIDVTGTGVGNTSSTYYPGCDTKDIAMWTGSTVQVWSACNVGATTSYSGSGQSVVIADTSITGGPDAGQRSYMGDYFQWHRNDVITNTVFTGVLASVSAGITSAGHSLFITGSSAFSYNWANFTGSSGDPQWTTSPCGSGYKMPSQSDWSSAAAIAQSNYNAFKYILKLPLAGDRTSDGQYISGHGKYWTVDPDGVSAKGLWLDSNGSGNIVLDSRQRSIGSSVRCIKTLSASGGNTNGQCGSANNGTFQPTNFINLTALNKCSSGTFGSQNETATGWTWSCAGSGTGVTNNCSALKPTINNSMSVIKNVQGTGSNLLELYFNEPIRLTGIDGSGGTSDDATGSIMTSGTGSPSVTVSGSLSNSGKLVFDVSGLNLTQSYELTLGNIVSFNYGSGGNTKQLQNGFKYPFVWGSVVNNATRLVDSYPTNRMANVPIGTANMELYFSKELSGATLTSTGIKLYEGATEVGYAVTSTYSSFTRADSGTGGKISVSIPAGSLVAGKGYKILVSSYIKDINNASIDGPNGYGNDQEIFFSTLANFTNNTATGTTSSLYVRASNPFPGAFNVPRNGKFQMEFSDPIDATGSNVAKIRVFAFSAATDFAGTDVTAGFSVSLDKNGKVLTLSGQSLLDASKKYELRANGDIRSLFGTYLGGGAGTSTGVVYTTNFTTGTGSDVTDAQVQWTFPGSGAVNQSTDLRSVDIGFDKPLDFSTISTQTVQLSQNGTAEVNLKVSYDIGTKTIHLSTPNALIANTTYLVTLIGGNKGLRTTSGNSLLGGDYTFSFTTGSAGNTAFIINKAEVYPTKIKVQFSHDVVATDSTAGDYASSVLNPDNYIIKYATGVVLSAGTSPAIIFSGAQNVSLSGASLSYDTLNRELTIMNISTVLTNSTDPTSQNLLGLMGTGITDIKGNSLSTSNGGDRFYGPVMSENFLSKAGGTAAGSTTGVPAYNVYDFTPVSLFPDINIAGKTSRYHLSFPTTQILGSGSVIELTFPTGFDVSSLSKDTTSLFPNSNITGSGNFSFTVSSVASNKVVLTLTNTDSNLRTGQKTYINMDFAGIINPTAAMEFGTDGYKVDLVTKTIGGSMVLESLRSNAIFIQPAGAYTLTVQLKQSDGTTNLAVPNLLVRLNGSKLGMVEGLSDAGGLVTFSGLNAGEYYVGTDPTVLDNTHAQTIYLGNPVPTRVNMTGNQAITMKLFDTSSDATLKTLTLNITGLPANENVVVWASSPSGYFEKRFSANGAGTVANTMKLKADRWQVGIRPDFGATAASSIMNYVQPGWQSPLPTDVDMTSSGATYTKALVSANRVLTVTLTDGTNPIPGASVWAYSPGGQIMGSNGMTDTVGQVQLKLMDGSYTIGAYAKGLPQIPENSIEISGNTSLSLVVKKPNLQIGGKILSGDTGIQNAGVYAYQINSTSDTTPKGHYANALTDSNGSYQLFVDANTVWKIGVFVPGIGGLDERIVSVGSASVTENFLASDIVLYNVSGTVSNLPANTFANVWAESSDAGDYYGNFGTTAADGTYSLQLKSGKNYRIHAFVPGLGEIGTLTVSSLGGNLPAQNFSAGASLNDLTINIKTSGTGGVNTTVDEFLVDYINTTTKVGGTKKVLSSSGVTLSLAPASYEVRIAMPGSSRLPSQTVNLGSGSGTLDFILANVPVTLSGTVRDQLGSVVSEAVVEVFNTGGINLSAKTNSLGVYALKVKGGTTYQIMTKKSGYIADSFTGVTIGSTSVGGLDLTLRNISTATDMITVSGSVYLGSTGSGNLAKLNAKVWAQGYNTDGTKNEKWNGTDTDENGVYVLKLKKGLAWKISSRSDGYEKIESITIGSGVTTNQSAQDMTLDLVAGYSIKPPVSTNVDPNNGGVLNDRKNKIKITLPVGALDGSKDTVTVLTKETSNVVDNGNSKPIGGSAKEITAMYTDGTAVTDFNSDVDIELSYSSGELLAALGSTGYTLENINNLLISYFDNATDSWRTIATTVLLYNSGGTLLGNSDLISVLDSVTLRGKTNHLTLFTSLVSTVVSNATVSSGGGSSGGGSSGGGSSGGGGGGGGGSSASITTGIVATFNGLSQYLGNVTQSIVLKSGTNINNVLSIKRDGKTIALTDLLKTGASTVSSVGKNLVSFAVGDVISTSKDGSLEIALDGYSQMQLSPGSSLKIAEAGNGFLSYENLDGNVQYHFDKRDGGKFEYKVKGKTGYATIRGTTLEVLSNSTKDTYKLIEGKIDIYNSILKKTVSLIAGDTYTVYASGKEDLTKMASLTPATTSAPEINPVAVSPIAVVAPTIIACGSYKDVDTKSEWCPYITKLSEKSIVRTSDAYEPDRNISRAELLKMASLSKGGTVTFNKLYTYTDIKSTDWWAPFVSTAKKLGYISATNTSFEPNRPITRAEAMKIIMNFSGTKIAYDAAYTYSDVKSTDWSAPFISSAKKSGIISATATNFRPNDPISRAEVAKILYNIFFK